MSDQETRLREALTLADDLREALDDQDDLAGDRYPWEHLGDSEGDVRKLLYGLRAVEAERDAAVKALERVRENARSWHGPPTDTGHERALAVIATWCDEALASLSAADTEPGGER